MDSAGVELYAVAAIPKPRARLTSWLVELEAHGPYRTRAGAYAKARELERERGASDQWITRVFVLRAPEASADV